MIWVQFAPNTPHYLHLHTAFDIHTSRYKYVYWSAHMRICICLPWCGQTLHITAYGTMSCSVNSSIHTILLMCSGENISSDGTYYMYVVLHVCTYSCGVSIPTPILVLIAALSSLLVSTIHCLSEQVVSDAHDHMYFPLPVFRNQPVLQST